MKNLGAFLDSCFFTDERLFLHSSSLYPLLYREQLLFLVVVL